MKSFTTFAAGMLLMTLASFASAQGNENWQVQRAKMDGSWAAMQSQLHPAKSADQISAENDYAGRAIHANPSNYDQR